MVSCSLRSSLLGSLLLVGALLALLAGVVSPARVGVAAQEATPSPELLADVGEDGRLTGCVDPSFPPMEYYEDQDAETPIGFDVDLVTEIGRRLGIEVDLVATEFTGLLPGLEAGRCDIIASGIYLTAERLQTFAAQPYFDSSVVLLTLADNEEIASPQDLSGKTIAVQSGTNYINIMDALNEELRAAGEDEVNVQTYPRQTDAIQQLIVGRADATITQDTEAAFRETAQPGQFTIAYTYPDPETFGIYYRPDATGLGAALASTVEAMRDDGTLAALATTWNLPQAGADFSMPDFSATPVATPAS